MYINLIDVLVFLGHVKLQRTTAVNREDRKKQEKREKRDGDNEETDRTIWVKYTLGLKHQVMFLSFFFFILNSNVNFSCRSIVK